MKVRKTKFAFVVLIAVAFVFIMGEVAEAKWPERPIEWVIPAGTGGGADQYTRYLIGLNVKAKYLDEAILPVNKDGGAGAVAMQSILANKGNGHMWMITLNAFITTPLFQNLPFSYKDYTPIALMALDNFPLWIHKDSRDKWPDAPAFIEAARKESLTVVGTGSKQEDEIVFRLIEITMNTKPFRYVPYKGGGDVAKALVGKHGDANVNQVSEALPFYPDFLYPLCVFQPERLTAPGFENVPTGHEVGIPIDFTMMRAIFAPPGISEEARLGMIEFFKKLSEDKEWQEYAFKTGLDARARFGPEVMKVAEEFHKQHIEIFKAQGWIK